MHLSIFNFKIITLSTMGKFLVKIAIFTTITISVIIAGLLLPATPGASKSHLCTIIQKDSLLANTDSPRIIFIGGSNIGFGLNSQMIKDSLHINPINTGLNASLGIKYMFDNTAQYIKEGDIVIAPLEYIHFTNDYNHCSEPLLKIVMDVNKKYLRLLNFRQAFNLLSYIPRHTISKFNPRAYLPPFGNINPAYDVNSCNQYGDACAHWNKENQVFKPDDRLDAFNQQIIGKIKDFEKTVEQKGGVLYITYPSYVEKSFRASEDIISTIQDELERHFKVLGTPERYMMPDSLMFDTSYHPNKKGLDIRTARLIEDIRDILKKE
jgi:hypothetical protein